MSNDSIMFEDGGVVTKFEIPTPTLYVGVYFYPNSEQPYGITSHDRTDLIKQAQNWGGIDRSRPVRIYTLKL